MKEAFIVTGGLLLQIVVGAMPFFIVKLSVLSKTGLGRLAGKLDASTKGITNRAREFGESRNIYQREQMARTARKNERNRSNVEHYAGMVTEDSARGRRLRRKAAGRFNEAGQQRVLYAGDEQLRRQRNEEASRAAVRLQQEGFDGDRDFEAIARTVEGQEYEQLDAQGAPTGRRLRVTEADRRAAINALVSQGRVSQIRDLEAASGPRGANGAPINEVQRMLDDAYRDHGGKLADKAPDLMPSRRTSNGVASFTDLKPEDVTGWHHSTVTAARNFYNTQRQDANGNVIVDPTTGRAANVEERDRMLRSFSQATQQSTTRSKLSLDQVTRVRQVLQDAQAAYAAGTGPQPDQQVAQNIDDMYYTLGGT